MIDVDIRRNEVIGRLKAKKGLRAKVDAKCCECIYDPISGNGTWRQQIESCTSPECPLYPVRTKSKVRNES